MEDFEVNDNTTWEEADFRYDLDVDDWQEEADRLAAEQLTRNGYKGPNRNEVASELGRIYFKLERSKSLDLDTEQAEDTMKLVDELHPTKNDPETFLDSVKTIGSFALNSVGGVSND